MLEIHKNFFSSITNRKFSNPIITKNFLVCDKFFIIIRIDKYTFFLLLHTELSSELSGNIKWSVYNVRYVWEECGYRSCSEAAVKRAKKRIKIGKIEIHSSWVRVVERERENG